MEKKAKRRKESCKAKTRNPPFLLQDQKGQLFFPLLPSPSLLCPGQAAASCRKIVPSPVGLHEEGRGCLLFRRGWKAPTVLEPAPPVPGRAPGVSHPGRYFRGRRGDNGKRDGRCRSQAHGKFLSRRKYFRRGFTMTAAGSFLHNPLYFGTKRRRSKPLLLPLSTAWRYRGADGFPTIPVPKLPVPTGYTVSSSCWKEKKMIYMFFLMGHQLGKAALIPPSARLDPPGPAPGPSRPTDLSEPAWGPHSRPPVAFAGYAEFGDEMRRGGD